MSISHDQLFADVRTLPDPAITKRFDRLVAIDDAKARLLKEAGLILDPEVLGQWSTKHYRKKVSLIGLLERRPPLFIIAGDVGTGKTEVAETFGSRVAQDQRVTIKRYKISLTTRGTGAVGEMTRLITASFTAVQEESRKLAPKGNGKARGAVIFLIDEADALAQSRELSQMHHEDRAGVNALIHGIDELANEGLPVLVVMCTNRLSAIDPAVRRRAAVTFEFHRPTLDQRVDLLKPFLEEVNFDADAVRELAELTGERPDQAYGFTYSDLTQRLLPALVIDALPGQALRPDRAREIVESMAPTPPFQEQGL